MDAKDKPARRMGQPGSQVWHTMLDGAETILRDEGHAKLTSRRVAEVVGVKQRLVYYYFQTMDELVVETFRRLAERELLRLEQAASAHQPLRELWDVCIHTTDSRITLEFMALANHNAALKAEVVHFIEKSRGIQSKSLAAALRRDGGAMPLPPDALALLATSLALALTRERPLGISVGHDQALDLVARLLERLDP